VGQPGYHENKGVEVSGVSFVPSPVINAALSSTISRLFSLLQTVVNYFQDKTKLIKEYLRPERGKESLGKEGRKEAGQHTGRNMQAGGMKDRRQERICRKEERRTGDREDSAGRRNEVQEIGRNRQAGRKKYKRQRGICRQEE
jgi:hypothetical protein